jgi:hypothetical protein
MSGGSDEEKNAQQSVSTLRDPKSTRQENAKVREGWKGTHGKGTKGGTNCTREPATTEIAGEQRPGGAIPPASAVLDRDKCWGAEERRAPRFRLT